MKDKNGNKRKLSIYYICWLIGCPILFTLFFLTLVFHFRAFDKYEWTEIIRINGITDKKVRFTSGTLKIVFLVDGEEYTVYFEEPYGNLTPVPLYVGDRIYYSAEDPDVFQFNRIRYIVIFSLVEAVIAGILIGSTIYEIKVGFK